MIKTLSIEPKFYERCLSQKPTCYGFIISGLAKDDECVFLLLTSLEKDTTDLSSINISELKLGCQKICRMLPAGSRVSGVYFCGPLDFNKSGVRIKEILHVIHQSGRHSPTDKFVSLNDCEQIFLHVDPVVKILTARAIGFDHSKDFLRPIEIKIRPVLNRWRAIKTHINLSVDTYLSAERQKEKIFQKLLEAVTPFLEAITERTRLLVDGVLKSESDLLFHKKLNVKATRNSKRHRESRMGLKISLEETEMSHPNPWDSTNFTLFGPDFPSWQRTNSSSSIDSGHGSDSLPMSTDGPPHNDNDKNLTIHGRIPGLAFLPVDGTTIADALHAFQRDLTHSILLRLELLTEELQISSGEVECARILLPSRVLVRIPACPACPLSDYKFFSETPDDVVRRVALFCHPLGSATPPAVLRASGRGSGDRLSVPDSGECSSDSEFNVPEAVDDDGAADEVVTVAAKNDAGEGNSDAEPVFDAACLDTELERTFCAGSTNELPDLSLITDMEVMAQSVSIAKCKIFLVGGAIAVIIISLLIPLYLDFSMG